MPRAVRLRLVLEGDRAFAFGDVRANDAAVRRDGDEPPPSPRSGVRCDGWANDSRDTTGDIAHDERPFREESDRSAIRRPERRRRALGPVNAASAKRIQTTYPQLRLAART